MFKKHYIIKEGPHREYEDLEFWPEEGVIIFEDKNNGDITACNCYNFYLRTKAIWREVKRCFWQDQRDAMNKLVVDMYEVWKEAKEQGDPNDIEVVRQKVRDRRRATLITGVF